MGACVCRNHSLNEELTFRIFRKAMMTAHFSSGSTLPLLKITGKWSQWLPSEPDFWCLNRADSCWTQCWELKQCANQASLSFCVAFWFSFSVLTSEQVVGTHLYCTKWFKPVWFGRDLKAHPVLTSCGQGCHPAAQAAQDSIKLSLECLQGWGTHSFSGRPVLVLYHPLSKEFPPNI